MLAAYGSDRVREAGGKVILHSRLSKGWTPRVAKTLTTSEHPGSAIYWDEQYFEVVEADSLPAGGVRYVLEPWRDEHVIRTFLSYDNDSEVRLQADYSLAARQRRYHALTRLSSIILGHMPSPVQNRLANELGVLPSRMTALSCIPPVVLLGVCAYLHAGAMIRQAPSPIPIALWFFVLLFFVESALRFLVAMSQNRGIGSVLGTLVYALVYSISAPRKPSMPAPLEEPGDGVFFMIPPEEHVALQDALTVKGPMLTLLPADDQERLARRFGFDYRQHSAFALTWTILVLSLCGVVSSWIKIQDGRVSGVPSILFAAAMAIEQIARLVALQRGPAGSMLGFVVRPFVRDLLGQK